MMDEEKKERPRPCIDGRPLRPHPDYSCGHMLFHCVYSDWLSHLLWLIRQLKSDRLIIS